MKETNRATEIEHYKKDIFSEDWEIAKVSVDILARIGGDDIVNFLIGLLDLEDSGIRNGAALALRDLKDNRAVEPLLKAILKPENIHYNGTLVYALQKLSCEYKLVDLFRILFHYGYEAKMGVYTILSEQIFEFTTEDLIEIQNMWETCNQTPEKYEGFDDDEVKLMMEDTYEGFMEYLKD